MQPLEKILFHANKTIATPDVNLAIHDAQACKILRRVYSLQQQDKWSLRQPKRCPEPIRPSAHWDLMLKEMKWMRTDFREERKWKRAVAHNLARACAAWLEASPEGREAMQVPATIPPKRAAKADTATADMAVDEVVESHSTPDLVPSGDVESLQLMDELTDHFDETLSPTAIFTMQEDDVIFGLRRTAAADRLLDELPMFGAPLEVPRSNIVMPEADPDAHWKRPALPLSKYVEGPMKLVSEGPPSKKPRFTFQSEELSDEDQESESATKHASTSDGLSPPNGEVALFNLDQKNIRDRLHAGHQFRPPSEYPMPTQGFFECRHSSQWTVAEDDELRGLVREYSYNWSLISNLLFTRSIFGSSSERRTPWECFERWINLEGLPSDMQRTQYFKAYNTRIETAQRLIVAQHQAAAQQATASGGSATPNRKRQSTPLRVERRRAQKHLTMIDAMRKLAKKRETAMQKQQHTAAQNAANKKTNEAASRGLSKTPRDYSLLRWERDQALADKMAQFAQRQEAQRRAAAQARNQAQMSAQQPQAQGAANGHHSAATNGVNGANRVSVPPQIAAAAAAAAAAQGRPRAQMQAPNGMSQMNGNTVPSGQIANAQQQMQALQNQQRMQQMSNGQHADPHAMMHQARRLQEQQRMTQMHQAQQHGGPDGNGQKALPQGSPPARGVNGMNQQSFMNNSQAMMASFNASSNGHSTPPASGLHMPNGAGVSPGPRPAPQIPPSIMAQINQLEAGFRVKNPSLTPEHARQLATEHLTRAMIQQRNNAISAAAGGAGQAGLASSAAATTSPHQYAAMLMRQQAQQQAQQHQQGQPPHPHSQQQSPPSQQQLQQQAQAQAQAQIQAQAQAHAQVQAQVQAQIQAQQQQQQPPPRTPMSTSPVPVPAQPQVHQRQSSGSAPPSVVK